MVCADTGRGSAALMQEVEQEVHEQVWFVEAGINERVDEECAVVQHEGNGRVIDLEGLQSLTCITFLVGVLGAQVELFQSVKNEFVVDVRNKITAAFDEIFQMDHSGHCAVCKQFWDVGDFLKGNAVFSDRTPSFVITSWLVKGRNRGEDCTAIRRRTSRAEYCTYHFPGRLSFQVFHRQR